MHVGGIHARQSSPKSPQNGLPSSLLLVREEKHQSNAIYGAIAGGVIVLVLASAILYVWFRRKKQNGSANTRSRAMQVVDRVLGRFTPAGGAYQPASGGDGQQSRQPASSAAEPSNSTAGVDRGFSIRSIMTLPAYRPAASQNEQVLGREGERDGIDVIIDHPTEEEHETMREQEMETLYQIRETRRQQVSDREARRRERQEATRRGDTTALAEIRARTRAANSDNTVNELREGVERIRETRHRTASSVSYADLGVARHDGSRIRAGSIESESMGLLSDTASIALVPTAASTTSLALDGHDRAQSMTSQRSGDHDVLTPGSRHPTRPDSSRQSNEDIPAGSEVLPSTDAEGAHLGAPPPEYENISLDDNEEPAPRSATSLFGPPPEYPGRDQMTTQDGEGHSSQNGDRAEDSIHGSDRRHSRLTDTSVQPVPAIMVEPSDSNVVEAEE